jgi:serpin B
MTEYTRLVLVNAIYFKGLWKHRFDEKLTSREMFHVSQGKQVQVDMMKITEIFWYGEIQELEARAISLPYKVPTHSLNPIIYL